MLSYYSSIVLLSWISLGILCILVRETEWISPEDKRMFYLTYLLIAVSALAEWAGIQMNGRADLPKWLLQLVKCCDYMLTPMAGGALVAPMKIRNRGKKILMGILCANAVFQLVSCFTGWMLKIDAQNRYSHGPLYSIYVLVYLVVILLVIVEFVLYGRSFRKQNRASVYAIMAMVIIGVCMQEILGGEHRTAYLTMTLGVALMFIHYTEFSQQTKDDHLLEQQIQIKTDALTGALSRHAYSKALSDFDAAEQLPQDLAVFAVDINELKTVNDTMGHEAGDELICGAATCIKTVFGDAGQCYRTGGDEFVIFGNMSREQAESFLQRLQQETKQWTGKIVKNLSLAAGYALASDFAGLSCEKLVKEADQAMYAAKAAYYQESGKDRRRRS